MSSIPPGLHPIRTLFGCCHILEQHGRVVVVDSGLLGMRQRFTRLFAQLGLPASAVEAIILTHGHIDHTANVRWLKQWTGAPVLAHPADHHHVAGRHPYRGAARICGALETLGRLATRYRPVAIDRPLHDGEMLPWWDGLRVVHLPGHTAGHCGLWSARHRLLFCGDLVAIWRWWSEFPPFYLNTGPAVLRDSLRRALALEPQLVVPNHYSTFGPFDPAYFARRFRAFAARRGQR